VNSVISPKEDFEKRKEKLSSEKIEKQYDASEKTVQNHRKRSLDEPATRSPEKRQKTK
jgi:hypothetical protein